MNLTVSNTNRILRSGNGPTVEYTGQDPIQVNNATHVISLNPDFSAQFAESGVEAKVDELSSCCEQVHSSISSLSSTVETISSELPDLEPYATKEWVEDQGYLTQIPAGYLTKAEAEVTYQPIGNYLTSADIENKLDVSALEYTDQGKISAYNGSAFVGEGGGTTYSAGQYVQIQGNVISVTGLQPEGTYATETELQSVSSELKDLIPSTDEFLTKASADTLYQPIGDYALTGDLNALSSLVDNLSGNVGNISSTVSSSVTSLSSDIAYISANCLTAHQSLEDYYKKTETSSKQEISEALASIQPGDAEVNQVVHTYSAEGKWLIASDLDPYLQKSESGNFYPMTGNPSGFVVSTELANYQTTAGMTGYATTGDLPNMNLYYLKTETSSNTEIYNGLNTKQNNLTFHYIEV